MLFRSKKRKRNKKRTTTTKHPVVMEPLPADARAPALVQSRLSEGAKKGKKGDDSDEERFFASIKGGSRNMSSLGFLTTLCQTGLDVASCASDDIKVKVVKFIERHYNIKIANMRWSEYSRQAQREALRKLNLTWSKCCGSYYC